MLGYLYRKLMNKKDSYLQAVRAVAAAMTHMMPQLWAPELTAVALQFCATNMAADRLPTLYAAIEQRAFAVLHTCSLQQVADLMWALHRADALTADFAQAARTHAH